MKKLTNYLGLGVLALPLQLSAVTLTINGVTYEGPSSGQFTNIQVLQDNGKVVITTDPEVILDYTAPIIDANTSNNDFSPVFRLSSQNFTVASGQTAVGDVEAVDADLNGSNNPPGTLSYSITTNPSSLFQISSTGTLSFVSAAVYNNPGTNVYFVGVRADDNDPGGSNTADTMVRVEVTDGSAPANTAPVFSGSNNYSITVNDGHTGNVATITATDAETSVSYSLTGADASALSISASGVLTFNSPPVHGTKSSYAFNVVATDQGSPALATTSPNVTISINAPSGGGACGATPANTVLGAGVNFAQPGSQELIPMDPAFEITSIPFTSTNNTAYTGYFQITSTTGNSNVSREAWISECPGGADTLSKTVLTECHGTGTSTTNVDFIQDGTGSFFSCGLQTNTQYYLNIKNVNCVGTCNVYRNIYTNNQP